VEITTSERKLGPRGERKFSSSVVQGVQEKKSKRSAEAGEPREERKGTKLKGGGFSTTKRQKKRPRKEKSSKAKEKQIGSESLKKS